MRLSLSFLLIISIQICQGQNGYLIHTDQSYYFAGETIRLSVLSENIHHEEALSTTICLNGELTRSNNFLLADGIGNAQLEIPDSTISGIYVLTVSSGEEIIQSIPVLINGRLDNDPSMIRTSDSESSKSMLDVIAEDSMTTAGMNSITLAAPKEKGQINFTVFVTKRRPKIHRGGSHAQNVNRKIKVNGYLSDEDDNTLINHSFMMVVPSMNEFYSAQTDENGKFELLIETNKKSFYSIFLSFSAQIHNRVSVSIIKDQCLEKEEFLGWETTSAKHELQNMVINDAFDSYSLFEKDDEERITYSGDYDRVINPHDYDDVKSMFQVFNDIVPKVHVRGNTFSMYALESTTKLKVPPLFFVNGIPTYDYDYILNIDPADVETIGVIASFKKLRNYFQAGNGGIIEINTTDSKEIVPPSSSNIVKLAGFDSEVKNFSINSNQVSFSSLLTWVSRLQLKPTESVTLNIPTSHESGEYHLIITGVSSKEGLFYQSHNLAVIQDTKDQ